ncbi:hypothetical protein RQP46_005526 [Phenoliferia psychrophenolica]
MLGSKVGMSTKSQDPDFDELHRKFTGLEGELLSHYTSKLVKDTGTFHDAVLAMLTSQAAFGTAFATLFQPILNETSLSSAHPEAATTLRNIAGYQDLMGELREAIQPELDLVSSRVTAPLKEYQDLLRKIRKTITKRDHKLVDYDRFNNSYTKLKDKKEKSLNDEKNLFKLEQDLETATQEYEHYNNSLKTELPHFMQLTTAFVSPLFQTFYFIKASSCLGGNFDQSLIPCTSLQVGILYTLLEKMQGWAGATYGEMGMDQLESMHFERLGDTIEQLDALSVTKRFAGTARLMSEHRQGSADPSTSVGRASSTLGRASSTTSSLSKSSTSLARPGAGAAYGAAEPAPPPYSTGAAAATSSLGAKRAPPPPPAPKPRPGAAAITYVTALYDYAATAEGDLSFAAGDKIQLVKKTDSAEDWWTGKLNGQEGVFPGNYVQL